MLRRTLCTFMARRWADFTHHLGGQPANNIVIGLTLTESHSSGWHWKERRWKTTICLRLPYRTLSLEGLLDNLFYFHDNGSTKGPRVTKTVPWQLMILSDHEILFPLKSSRVFVRLLDVAMLATDLGMTTIACDHPDINRFLPWQLPEE